MRIKIGDYLSLEFYDHASLSGDETTKPMKFEAVGRLVHVDAVQYIIATWHFPEQKPDANCEYFSIIRSTITKIRRLK